MRYVLPVAEADGGRALAIALPPNLRNAITLHLPGRELDARLEEAVFLAVTNAPDQGTLVQAVLGPSHRGTLAWKPRAGPIAASRPLTNSW